MNTIIHYSIFNAEQASATYMLISMFKFAIFFFIMFYYVSKANSLLVNRRNLLKGLRVFFVVGLTSVIGLGIFIAIDIHNRTIHVD